MDKESEKMWKQIKNKLLNIKSLSIDRYEALLDKYEQLQAENERLKDFLNHSFCDCELNEKYRQALQEIKTLLSQVDENNWLHTGKHIYMDDRCISELKARIQAKINEVIGAEE